ncbi:hypothetical protein D8674_039454 [Pyrus ussuriensis x Pyrus communis]|uniref:Uncharacterized protein n=1 Tax=Pyrus ussuriensis x Pyrus communis TaxID=2448454 RepID=A0A5N5HCL3_9ROSA|nr:hypothetical protein D8674_039454 [Pyrus ussuriensis x Pyrus communis]
METEEDGEEMEVDEEEEEMEVEQMVEEQIEEEDEEETEEEKHYDTIKYLLMAIQAIVHVLKEFIIISEQSIEHPLNRQSITTK